MGRALVNDLYESGVSLVLLKTEQASSRKMSMSLEEFCARPVSPRSSDSRPGSRRPTVVLCCGRPHANEISVLVNIKSYPLPSWFNDLAVPIGHTIQDPVHAIDVEVAL